MKHLIFKTIAVLSIAVLVFMVVDWANPMLFSSSSMVSLAEATSGHTHTHSHGNWEHSHWHTSGWHHNKKHNHSHDNGQGPGHNHNHSHGNFQHSHFHIILNNGHIHEHDDDLGHTHTHRHGNFEHSHFHNNTGSHNHSHDRDAKADCDSDVYVNQHIGICSNRATVTVVGMKRYVHVSSGSGAVLAEVNSKAVQLRSKSGDLTARGLTKFGIFKTRIGNVRVKYCKKVKKNTGNLYVEIIDSPSGVDEDGDPNEADADLQFTSNSKVKPNIARDANKFKSDFISHNNGLVINGSVTKGNLFISEFPIADPACPF